MNAAGDPREHLRGACFLVGLTAFAWCAALVLLSVFRIHGGDPTGPAMVGEISTANRVEFPTPIKLQEKSVGYDGQYFLMLAYDPLLRGREARGLDRPVYRARRILLPVLASISGQGSPIATVLTFHFWNILLGSLGAWAIAWYAVGRGRSPWWGMAYALNAGVFVCMWRMVGDAAFASLLVLCFVLWDRGKIIPSAIALAVAMLAKETGVFAAAALAGAAVLGRNGRNAGIYAASAIPFFCWHLYASHATAGWDDFGMPFFNFAVPGVGALLNLDLALSEKSGALLAGNFVFIATCVGSAVLGLCAMAIGLVREWRASLQDALLWALAGYSALGLCLSYDVWVEHWAYGRVLLPVAALVLMQGLTLAGSAEKPARLSWPFLAISLLGAMNGLAYAVFAAIDGRQ